MRLFSEIFADRVAAVEHHGYTRRDAEFLVTAALHSGYFIRRQFAPQRGKTDAAFCAKLAATRHAKVIKIADQTQLYHIGNKPFFRLLIQDDNRHRRRHESIYIRAKLMLLDYVLTQPQGQFLPTEEEKIEYFCQRLALPEEVLPVKVYYSRPGRQKSQTKRYFVEKYPIQVDPETGLVSFGFIDDGAGSPPSFRLWISQYERLIRAVPKSRIVFVTSSRGRFGEAYATREFERVFGPKEGTDAPVLEYFRLRKRIEEEGLAGRPQAVLDRYKNMRRIYGNDRIERQYSAWKTGPIRTSNEAQEVALVTHALTHDYGFLGTAFGGLR